MSRVEQAGSGKKLLMTASRASHITQFHLPYLQWFQEHGWQVDVAAQGRRDIPYSDHYYELPFSKKDISFQNIKTAFWLAKLIRRERYSLVISHATLAGFITKLAVVLSGCRSARYIAVCHGYLFKEDGGLKNRLYFFCERLFRGRVDCLLTMNRADEELAKANRLCRHIAAIPGMGICPEALPRLSAEEKKREKSRLYGEWDLSDRQTLLLCVGEFSVRKNQLRLIEAFANVAGRYPQARLLLAGEGALLPDCRRLVQEKGLEKKVLFLGQRRDVAVLLQCCCNALVTASRSEGLPFTVMEALYCGKPVLASEVKGHTDLIQDGVNGFLFSPDDPLEPEKTLYRFFDGFHFEQEALRLPRLYLIDHALPQVLSCYLGHEAYVKEESD